MDDSDPGSVVVLFGVMVFAWPGISLLSLVLLFGAFVLADGFGNVVTAIGGGHEHENWWVLMLAGLAGAALGVLTFFNPGLTALARRTRLGRLRNAARCETG